MHYVNKHKVSVQMAARELRYAWFAETTQKNDLEFLVTAHHADDNLETFLINLSRGTGINGLTGIPERNGATVRPLLAFSRECIKAYADEENIEWREDRTNTDTKYLRNAIRHKILPELKALSPNFLANFQKTQSFLSQSAAITDAKIQELSNTIIIREQGTIKIPVAALSGLKPLQGYIYGLFEKFGFTECNDIKNLLTAMSGKEVRSKTHRLVKDREFLILKESTSPKNRTCYITAGQATVDKPVKMRIIGVDAITETGRNILYVDEKALKYPLTLRKWEKGDYFYPFGMRGSKKISKFFKDEKVDVIAKESQWLLCSGKAIVWVVGRRSDERFKITENTERILKFELK